MGIFDKAKRSINKARYHKSAWVGQLMAQVHFGELEGAWFPASVGEARDYVVKAGDLLSPTLTRRISKELGLADSSVLESLETVGRGSFQETLENLLLPALNQERFAPGARSDSGARVLPIGTLLLDDLKGGPRVQAQMWAESHARSASASLRLRGATNQMNLRELSSVDPDSFSELVLAYVLLGVLTLDHHIAELVREPWRQRLLEAAAAYQHAFGILERLPTRLTTSKKVAQPSPPDDNVGMADMMSALRLQNTQTFDEQLLEAGVLSLSEVFDRTYLPLRIHRGARWNPREGIVGEPTSVQIDDELRQNMKKPPVYFPFILRPLVTKDTDPLKDEAYLLGEESYLYFTDPQVTYTKRIEQMSWISEFGYWRE
jgi:hypothetical protein